MLLPILINVMRLEFRKGLSRCRWKHIIVKCIAIIIKYESISKYIKTISNYIDSFPYGTASLKTYFLNPLLHNVCKIFKVCLTILRHCEVKGYFIWKANSGYTYVSNWNRCTFETVTHLQRSFSAFFAKKLCHGCLTEF